MQSLNEFFGTISLGRSSRRSKSGRRGAARLAGVQALESRQVMDASPLPVLLVIADQRDFYYQEYGDTRAGLESRGLDVVVAATTTQTSLPHANTGEPAGTNGAVTPDIALTSVDPDDYSAIVFVGGWGSSMYQYSFEGTYSNAHYNGDLATKTVVNDLINEFVDQDKYVAAVCHGVTVLAWARVDGVSPLGGKTVSVPWIGGPAGVYDGQWYGYFEMMQYDQVVANGAIANTVSGQYGDPNTAADDVVVDGRIITAENYDAAYAFGQTIAAELFAQVNTTDPLPEPNPPPAPPANNAPTIADATFSIAENSAANTLLGNLVASDPDVGQTLTFAIVSGNTNNAFAIDPATGALSVVNSAALDYEATPQFNLVVSVTDNAPTALSASASVTVNLTNVVELPLGPFSVSGGDLYVQGTPNTDYIYVWTSASGQAFAWLNGQTTGPHSLPAGGRVIVHGGASNDYIYATDSHVPVAIYGEGGHDVITGGSADDFLSGGEGTDRIWAAAGNDLVFGDAGNDFLDGGDGDDIVLGGDGNDVVAGQAGRDVLIGGLGGDRVDGGAGEDLLIGGTTSYDNEVAALTAIMAEWRQASSLDQRAASLAAGIVGGYRLQLGGTIFDDNAYDCLNGAADADWLFALPMDTICTNTAGDRIN